MTTQNDNSGQPGNDSSQGTPPAAPATPTLDEVAADRDRWKALSRQNEANYNATRTELQQLQTAQQAAVEAARTEGRTAALGEVSQELVTAELRLQAATAGAELPDLKYLDLSQFRGESERPNADAVKAFVESLSKRDSGGDFPHLAGAGHNRGSDGKFSSLDPNELADFISGGNFL
ncbi:hypothetical protein ACFV6G_00620 [Streptomyces lavendulae]|uniref:hypothetical protein n=1 Tax=Streptomyces lavendulae TaxID=1914 RepID=UPI0036CE6B3B